MKKEIFKILIQENLDFDFLYLKERDLVVEDHPLITTIIGPRRGGKTSFLLKHMVNRRKSTKKDQSIYINFEDDRLFPLEVSELQDLIDAYFELFPSNRSELIYLYLDEIQIVKGWETFVRRIHDHEKVRLFISGSSSKMLSSEIATSLRGRTLSFEMFPLSFPEYLRFRNIAPDIYSPKNKSFIMNALNEYLNFGGFPDLLNIPEATWSQALNQYFELTIYKDLIERHNIANHYVLKLFLKQCVKNPATLLSMSKSFRDLKSMGIQIAKNTLYDYFEYFQENYTLFAIPVYRRSVKEQQVNPKKVYTIDNGFYAIQQYRPDKGKQYENVVFLHLRRKSKDIYYYKGTKEVDFCIETVEGHQLINVSYDLSLKETLQREISSLSEAMNDLKTTNGIIITAELEKDIKINGGIIHIVPLYKWLLGHNP